MTVRDVSLRQESRDRYLTYALSVVTGRALPDVRDGLKPVQRRILYAMFQNLNLKPASNHRKSAAVVGEVLARFHPHGDTACYEAMVRMAQDFSLRYPLVDGQGNFGSLDGDGAAAYRYTEAKLLPIALEVVGEINEETVDYIDNFDATTQEPEVLPSRLPNLLMNGATGIAVGMATNIPPHNLRELVAAIEALSEDPELSASKLSSLVKGPDFPTGCEIVSSKKEITDIYKSGKGAICMRGSWKVEESARGKRFIVIQSIPYGVNKSQLVEKIADAIIKKKVPQLLDIRDESTAEVRIVLELASGASEEAAIAFLFKNTPLQSNFNVNLTALVPVAQHACRPELLSMKECLQYFLDFRMEVVERRLRFEKKKLLERIHILEGFVKIFDALDEAIKIVRKSSGRQDAAEKLRKRFKLSEIQSFAIVDMRIYQLSKTNIEEIRQELDEKRARVKAIDALLKSKKKITKVVIDELKELAQEFGDSRKSKIVKDDIDFDFNEADYVVREDVYAILTRDGWIKRIRQSNELSSTRVREGDSIAQAHPLSTLDSVCFFTNLGYLYLVDVKDFPASSGYGTPVQKVLKFRDGERIVGSFAVVWEKDEQGEAQQSLLEEGYPLLLAEGDRLLLCSSRGMGYALEIEGLDGIKRNGKRIMKLRKGDALVDVVHLKKRAAFFTAQGSALSIASKEIPERSTPAIGVALMGVRKDDEIVGIWSFNTKGSVKLELSNGKEKELKSSDVTSGKRALKGKKVVSRAEIVRVLHEH